MSRTDVLDEFLSESESFDNDPFEMLDRMADEIVRLRELVATVDAEREHAYQVAKANEQTARRMEQERDQFASMLHDCENERDGWKHRAERMERVVQMLRIASVLPSPDLLTDGDWADLCEAVRALDAEAQP